MWIILFITFSALLFDVRQAARYKEEVKIALNNATKAATLQIDKDPAKIGLGIFEIDPVLSRLVFEDYLSDNLSTAKDDLFIHVIDYKAINTHSPVVYLDIANGNTYNINYPTFVAVMEFTYKGLFMTKTIEINNISGTRLRSSVD